MVFITSNTLLQLVPGIPRTLYCNALSGVINHGSLSPAMHQISKICFTSQPGNGSLAVNSSSFYAALLMFWARDRTSAIWQALSMPAARSHFHCLCTCLNLSRFTRLEMHFLFFCRNSAPALLSVTPLGPCPGYVLPNLHLKLPPTVPGALKSYHRLNSSFRDFYAAFKITTKR